MKATLSVLLISYLLGSIPTAIWVGKITKGIDVRQHGSGNAGATNSFRVLGWPSGIFVLLFDLFKGFAATFFVSSLAFKLFSGPVAPGFWDADSFLKIMCGLFAVMGHMFPVFAKFKGGKGAATAAGMLLGIEPISIGISLILFILIILLTKYVSLASMIASFVYPITLIVMRYSFGLKEIVDESLIIFSAIVAFGIIIKHKTNIKRLIAGTEGRIGDKRNAETNNVEKAG